MSGLMMEAPLTLHSILDRAERLFGRRPVVSRLHAGTHRTTWAEVGVRARKLASALASLGVKPGDRVATFAWNSHRHLEAYFGIPCMGAVMHNLNIRLHQDQIAYILEHAGSRVLLVDASLVPAARAFLSRAKRLEHIVVLPDGGEDADVSVTTPCHDYEDLLASAGPFEFLGLPENQAAGLCYTSGTTGEPKGVLYSHRAFFLHSLASAMTDVLAISERDTAFCVVPMFHANAWGIPYTAAMVGAGLVFPGPFMQPADLASAMEAESVTLAAGVPSLWAGLYHHLKEKRYDLSRVNRMVIGGSACPPSLIEGFERDFGLRVIHAWGMTETTPLGTVSRPSPDMDGWSEADVLRIRACQGRPVPGVELRIVGEGDAVLPWDGQAVGEVQVRGPWVAKSYFKDSRRSSFTPDDWFKTGDVATVTPEGYMSIADRTKDLVKSGGEWISSIALENAILSHPGVREACVIAVPHEKWGERPLALIVAKEDPAPTADAIRTHLAPLVAKWWIPEDVRVVPEIPKTSVGKFDKKLLRARYAGGPGLPAR